MTIRTYSVTLGAEGGLTRDVRVASPTDVQAGDAARPLMSQGESILSIVEIAAADPSAQAEPPKSQAAELAPVTPGAAAAPLPGGVEDNDYG
ncbi:hypothetical protein ACIQC9_00685 [Brevundimonas sp. NPDC092305]|uniref:hypothetical protein n=1 Tax=Brevundimonas sp. NPDC092305 TaxID=3363957 RepID=UPI003828B80E